MRIDAARIWLMIILAAIVSGAAADEIDGAEVDIRPSLLSDEWYSEGWDQIFYFPDGTLLVSQLTVLNIGFGGHHAGVFAMHVSPDGRKTVIKQSRSNREWEFSETGLDLQVANHRLRGQAQEFQVLIRKGSREMDVRFESTTEAWRPGKTLDRDGDYQYVSFYAPLANATARYTLDKDQETSAPKWHDREGGRGFALRYVNSTGLHDLILNSTRIVDLERSSISPVIYTSVDTEGGAQNHLALFEDGRVLHESVGFDLQTKGRIETADDDTRDIPDHYSVEIEEDGFTLRGTVEIEKFLARVDPVDSLKPFVRTLVKLLNTPIQYRYLARYDFEYTSGGGTTRLQGRALMDHMVLRHEKKQHSRSKNTR